MLASTSTTAQVINASLRAYSRLQKGGATISFRETLPGHNDRQVLIVSFVKGKRVQLEIKRPGRGDVAASDRVYVVAGSTMTGYDRGANQRLRRSVNPNEPIAERIASVLGPLPDPVRFFLEPAFRSQLLKTFLKEPGFREVRLNGLVELKRTSKVPAGIATTVLDFDRQHLLTGLHIRIPSSRLDWTIQSHSSFTPLVIPPTALPVAEFAERLAPPYYASVAAKMLATRMVRAEAGLGAVAIKVGKTNSTSVFLANGAVREMTLEAEWVYRDGTLSVRTSHGFFRGRCGTVQALQSLGMLNVDVNRIARAFLLHKSYFAGLLLPRQHAALIGRVIVQGEPCDLLQIRGPHMETTLSVDAHSSLVARVDETVMDATGATVMSSTRSFRYQRIRNVPRSVFTLEPWKGQRVQPLPQ